MFFGIIAQFFFADIFGVNFNEVILNLESEIQFIWDDKEQHLEILFIRV